MIGEMILGLFRVLFIGLVLVGRDGVFNKRVYWKEFSKGIVYRGVGRL